MALLLDIEHVHDDACNHAIDLFYKAGTEPPGDGIWDPLDSPFVARIVALFTERGLTRIAGLQEELNMWLAGERHHGGPRQPRPIGMMERWTPGELSLARLYLETLPPAQFTLDDWMMVVEYLVQRYLPAEAMKTEAEWLATKSNLMGRVQANVDKISAGQADKLLSRLPSTVAEAYGTFPMTRQQRAAIEFGNARCAEYVVNFSDSARAALRRTIVNWQESVFLGRREPHGLETVLFDQFSAMNRDWRRIAVTEACEMQNQGVVASLPEGAQVKRIEVYATACNWCQSIHGMVFEVVAADKPDKDGDKQVWVGKTNVRRSAAPRKRVGGALVEREPAEMFWVAAGSQHPHCRGRWQKVAGLEPSADPEFAKWLAETLR
jgi:hypothetical protein